MDARIIVTPLSSEVVRLEAQRWGKDESSPVSLTVVDLGLDYAEAVRSALDKAINAAQHMAERAEWLNQMRDGGLV